ncbi:MAG: type III pantothenate kinase [Bacteroidales bacterium]
MNFIIDIGNSSTKVAVYEGFEKVISLRTKQFSWDKLREMLAPYTEKLDRCIVSTVRDTPEFVIDLATHGIPNVQVLSHVTRLPFRNEYETPETLGTDRIAAIAGAFHLFQEKNILVIDAGSAVTYDYLSDNAFKGGNISPGLSMRFRALHHFTRRLPLVSTTEKVSAPGKNTLEAITAGVINGLIFEINEYIERFNADSSCEVIMTGGDSGYLRERIAHIVTYMPDLVLDGLNYILEYNAGKN